MSVLDRKPDPFADLGEIPAAWRSVAAAHKTWQGLVDEREQLTAESERLRKVTSELAAPLGVAVPDPGPRASAHNERVLEVAARLHELEGEIAAAAAKRHEALAKDGLKFAAEEEANLRDKLVPAFAASVDELAARHDAIKLARKRIAFLRGEDTRKGISYDALNVNAGKTDSFGAPVRASYSRGVRNVVDELRDLAEGIEEDLKPKAKTFLAESAEEVGLVGTRRGQPNVPLSMGGARSN